MLQRFFGIISAVFLFWVSGFASADATTWRVEQDGTGDFTTISSAIAAASDGDTIEIGPGVYPEHLTVTIGLDFVSTAGADLTVLDGTNSGRIMRIDGATPCSLTELTYYRGNADPGGALFVDAGGTVDIVGCIFESNFSSHDGGAIFCQNAGSAINVVGCAFYGNVAVWNNGAAGASMQSEATFSDCVFMGNSAGTLCGGIANFNDSPITVEGCLFVHNSALAAGAILIQGSSATIRNNTFFANTSGAGDGATVNFYTGSECVFENNIVSTDQAGYGVRLLNNPVHGCNIFFENAAGAVLDGSLNDNELEIDPLFCADLEDDFNVCADSPALPENNDDCDLIGAYGSGCPPCAPVATETLTWSRLKTAYR